MQYKVLFVGLGSIGQRHLKNLISLADVRVDALRTKNESFENIETVYTDYENVPDDYDIIFITNPTTLHYEAISKLKNKTKNMFIEKPIFEKPYECEFSKGVNYIACPLRHNSEVKALKVFVENNNVYSFRAICSSYLPKWRKTGDYRNYYSAKADMGGGVELDLIHEIDYLKWIFGKFNKISKLSGKKSDLEITSNDIAAYIFENKNIIGSLHLDYFGRETKRQVEVFAQNETKIFDLTKNKDDMYIEEMKYFLNLIETQDKNGYNTPKEALESLEAALS
ncbi:Gfo/Idh/MocA family oxidoreductase [bacterium]|nr:Gfo/Idh/MocA family oxidoreductase [bacterium]